jgi:hypothetical protein
MVSVYHPICANKLFLSIATVFSRMPRRAPELLNGIARRGDAGMHCVDDGAWKPLSATPFKSEEHRIQAASGSPFLWLLSFGETKESNPPAGAATGIKTIRRDSDTISRYKKHESKLNNQPASNIGRHSIKPNPNRSDARIYLNEGAGQA